MTAPKSVLIIRPGALGDAVLTLPALRALKASGTERITVLGNPSSWAFVPPDEPGFEVLDWNTNNWLALFSPDAKFPPNVLGKLKTFDLAVVYLKPDRTEAEGALLKAGVKHVIGITPPGMDEIGEVHASEWLLGPLREKLGLKEHYRDVHRVLNANWVDWEKVEACLAKLELDDTPYIAIHPGSGGSKKCWPAERFARMAQHVCRKTKWPMVLFSGPADDAVVKRFDQVWNEVEPDIRKKIRRVHGQSIRELMHIVDQAPLYFGNDSGISHLVSWLSVTMHKTILFGPTDPRVWRPLGERVDVVTASEDGSLAPMEDLTEEKVLAALSKRMGFDFS